VKEPVQKEEEKKGAKHQSAPA
jgi:hypothetical protein